MLPDNSLLAGVNLGQFTETQKQTILENFYKQLEDRLGDKVTSLVDDEKFIEFENLVDQGDEDKINAWVETNIPNYEQESNQIFEGLKQELATNPQNFLA